MEITCHSVLSALELRDTGRWERGTAAHKVRGPFVVTRYHFLFEDRSTGKFATGEIVNSYTHGVGHGLTTTVSVESQREDFELQEFAREEILSQELTAEAAASIQLAKAGLLGGELKSALREIVGRSVSRRENFHKSVRKHEARTHSFEWKSPTESHGETVVARKYQRRHLDAYLVYVDYLEVSWEPTAFGLRLRRTKTPPFYGDQRQARVNEVFLNLPLGRFSYWKLDPDSATVVDRTEWKREVKWPDDVTRSAIPKPRHHDKVHFKDVKSLYAISNVAFSRNKLKAKSSTWSEAEVAEAEGDLRDTVWTLGRRRP